MTQVFTTDGKMIAVTALRAVPNKVVARRTKEKDGYAAVTLGIAGKGKVSKPLAGQLKKAGITSELTHLHEFKTDEQPEIGSTVDVASFAPGDKVNVSGVSKGKGYAGVIKRHHFSRGPETHGSDHHRKPGSIGSMFPQRVVKGRRLPGHLGSRQVTVKQLEVAEVHPESNLLLVKGAIPGSNGSLIEIQGVVHD